MAGQPYRQADNGSALPRGRGMMMVVVVGTAFSLSRPLSLPFCFFFHFMHSTTTVYVLCIYRPNTAWRRIKAGLAFAKPSLEWPCLQCTLLHLWAISLGGGASESHAPYCTTKMDGIKLFCWRSLVVYKKKFGIQKNPMLFCKAHSRIYYLPTKN